MRIGRACGYDGQDTRPVRRLGQEVFGKCPRRRPGSRCEDVVWLERASRRSCLILDWTVWLCYLGKILTRCTVSRKAMKWVCEHVDWACRTADLLVEVTPTRHVHCHDFPCYNNLTSYFLLWALLFTSNILVWKTCEINKFGLSFLFENDFSRHSCISVERHMMLNQLLALSCLKFARRCG